MARSSYRSLSSARQAARSSEATAIVAFFRDSLAYATVATALNVPGNGRTFPKDASGTVTVGCGRWEYARDYNASGGYTATLIPSGYTCDVKLVSSNATTNAGRLGRNVRAFSHRLTVRCPDCGAWIPTGRIGQHAGSATCIKALNGSGR